MNIKGALKGKIFGMPRWLFFSLVVVGIVVGVYLRRRNMAGAEPGPDGTTTDDLASQAEDYGSGDQPVGAYPDDPGLAGVGIATQPSAGVIPVSAPYIPEGLVEIIGDLTGTISDIALTEPPDAISVPPGEVPTVVTTPTTGGGPPKRVSHTPTRPRVPRTEATRRVQQIQRRHGARSPAATRAAKRLGLKSLPKPKAKAKPRKRR